MILVKWLMAMTRKRRCAGATRIPAPLVSRWQKEMQDAISAATCGSDPRQFDPELHSAHPKSAGEPSQ